MRSLSFVELFAMLPAAALSAAAVARLREWIASMAPPAECIALIEQAAAVRPCPHCSCGQSRLVDCSASAVSAAVAVTTC